jgi:PAS domain S-box-containing protein
MTGSRLGQILVVDDEVELKNALTETLNAQGYDATGYTSGKEALSALRGQNFDVLLSDLLMPEMDGITLLREALEIDPYLICIITTGEDTIQTAVDAMKFGAFDYVLKPFKLQAILPVLTRAINVRRLQQENLRLRENEDRYRDLFEHSHDLICTHDLEGRILSLNQSAAKALGYDRETLLGRNIRESLSPESRDRFDVYVAEIRKNGIARGLMTVRTQTGEKCVWEYTNTLRTEGVEVPIVRGLAHDVTEQRRAEEALRESEERYRVVAETATDVIITIDEDSTILFANRAVERVFGYTVLELLGKKITMLMPEHLRHVHKTAVGSYIETDRKHINWESVELPGLHKSGREIPLELSFGEFRKNGRHLFTGIARDITERKRFEEALRREKEYTEHIISAAPTLIVGIAPDGTTTFINQAITRVTGYDPEEIVGQNWWRTYYPGEEYRQVEQFFKEFEERDAVINYEMTLTTKSGDKRTVSWNSVNRSDESGEIIEIIGIGADVTERRELEDQLRQSQKLEAIGQLAGGVAHDFNNMLTIIIGYSDLLLRGLGQNEPMRLKVEEIKKAGERASSLTRQLLAFSRKQVLQPKVLQLNSVVTGVDKMLRRLIGEDIELLTVLATELGSIEADPGQIEQVIMNLVVNARDAMPQGGKLTIETKNVYLDESYAKNHIAVTPGAYVMLAVSDTGTGMDEKTKAHIFEPFFTTKEIGKGTGLGLSTVYGIVKQSGGDIWVYSEMGEGTTFKIYLPQVDGVVESDEARHVPAGLLRGHETVLLAEDEEQVRQTTRTILEMDGYRVLEASGGSEALAIFKQHEGRIDLAITDVIMPQMSGQELAQSLKALCPDIKVLYVSGYTDDAIVRHGLLDEEIAFIQKPFTPEALSRKVREVLDAAPGS